MKAEKIIRILSVTMLVGVLLYFGVNIYKSSASNYKTETAMVQSVLEAVDAEMFVIRSEKIIKSKKNVIVVPLAKNGSKVGNGAEVGAVFKSETAAENYSKAIALQNKLDIYKKISNHVRLANLDLGKLSNEIANDYLSMLASVYYNEYSDLSDRELSFDEKLSRKLISEGKDVDCEAKIASLEAEIEKLSEDKPLEMLKTDTAGFFVSRPDGYENIIDVEDVDSLTAKDLEDAFKAKKGKIDENAIGKVINGFEWYVACIVSTSDFSGINEGATLRLLLGNTDNEAVKAKIYSKTPLEDNKTMLVFKCNSMNEELSTIRKLSGKIIIRSHKGIKLRKDAIRFNSENKPGVYIIEGNLIKFNRIEELYSGDNYVVAKDKTGVVGWLAQYDEVVVSGKGLSNGKVIR